MRLRTPSPAIGLVIALGSAAGCGGEEMFLPELGSNELLIDTEAFTQIARGDEGVEDVVVVGDLDGDGIDDAVIRTAYLLTNGGLGLGSAVYVVYGGPGVTGKIDMAQLPTLIHTGAFGGGVVGGDVIPVGDVDGDGLADFMVGIARTPGCGDPTVHALGDNLQNAGAYIIYGNHTRLTGTHPIDDAGVFLRDPVPCTAAGRVHPLGDIDGDGKADFAIGRRMEDGSTPSTLLVFYGRSPQLSGTVDLTTTADAAITNTPRPQDSPLGARVGDVDGDGIDDFLVVSQIAVATSGNTMDVRLVRGSATRLSGSFAEGDLGATQFLVHTCIYPPEVDALGDLDGDGADDFALSGCVGGSLGEQLTNDYHLFYGRKGGFPAQVGADDQDATLPTSHTGPSQLIGGDADGDGISDLILADVGLHDGNGGVHLLRGRTGVRLSGVVDPIVRSFVTYVGEPLREDQPCMTSSCSLGAALGWGGIAVGDVTGDHRVDLLIGAPTSSISLPEKGGPFDRTPARIYGVSPPVSAKP